MSTLGEMSDDVGHELQETTANYFSEADRKYAIGQAYKLYFQMMVNNGEGYFVEKTNLAITGGNEEVDLSALDPAFRKIKILQKNTSVGQKPLDRYERRFESNSFLGVSTGDAYYPTWRMRNRKIVLEPRPISDEAASSTTGLWLEYYYVPEFPTSSTSDSFEFDSNFDSVFEPNVVLRATIALLEQKDGMGAVSDTSAFRRRLDEMDLLFLSSLNKSENIDFVVYTGEDYFDF